MIIDIKDLSKLDIRDLNIILQIDRVSELSLEQLNKLLRIYKIKEIHLGQISYYHKCDKHFYDIMSKMYDVDSSKMAELEKINKLTLDIYDVETYTKIINKMNDIINSIKADNNIQLLKQIFDYISNNIKYDDNGVEHTVINNQNLYNVVFNNIGVCEGISKLYMQLLSLVGIDSIIVSNSNNKANGGHLWNQVKLDNNWYNSDVTSAIYCINNNLKVWSFLVSDKVNGGEADSTILHKCNKDYSEIL